MAQLWTHDGTRVVVRRPAGVLRFLLGLAFKVVGGWACSRSLHFRRDSRNAKRRWMPPVHWRCAIRPRAVRARMDDRPAPLHRGGGRKRSCGNFRARLSRVETSARRAARRRWQRRSAANGGSTARGGGPTCGVNLVGRSGRHGVMGFRNSSDAAALRVALAPMLPKTRQAPETPGAGPRAATAHNRRRPARSKRRSRSCAPRLSARPARPWRPHGTTPLPAGQSTPSARDARRDPDLRAAFPSPTPARLCAIGFAP